MYDNQGEIQVSLAGQGAIHVSLVGEEQAMGIGLNLEGTVRLAEKANQLAHPRRIALIGDVDGDALFDGSEDAEIYTAVETLSNEELEAMLI